MSNGSLLAMIKNPGKLTNNLFYVVAGQKVAIAHNITINVVDNATAKSIANNLTNKTINLNGSF